MSAAKFSRATKSHGSDSNVAKVLPIKTSFGAMRAPPSTCQPFAFEPGPLFLEELEASTFCLTLQTTTSFGFAAMIRLTRSANLQLGGLLTLKQPRVAVEDLQFSVEILLGLAFDVGDGLDPELLYAFHSRQLAVASEGHSLKQHILVRKRPRRGCQQLVGGPAPWSTRPL